MWSCFVNSLVFLLLPHCTVSLLDSFSPYRWTCLFNKIHDLLESSFRKGWPERIMWKKKPLHNLLWCFQDLTKVKSEKTGRGPFGKDWRVSCIAFLELSLFNVLLCRDEFYWVKIYKFYVEMSFTRYAFNNLENLGVSHPSKTYKFPHMIVF